MGERLTGPPQASGVRLTDHLDRTGASGIIDAFGRELANRIKTGVGPEGYTLAVEQFHAEIAVDGLADEPLPEVLIGLPPILQGVLRVGVRRLTTEAFGDNFGRAVDEIYEKRLPQLMEAHGAGVAEG